MIRCLSSSSGSSKRRWPWSKLEAILTWVCWNNSRFTWKENLWFAHSLESNSCVISWVDLLKRAVNVDLEGETPWLLFLSFIEWDTVTCTKPARKFLVWKGIWSKVIQAQHTCSVCGWPHWLSPLCELQGTLHIFNTYPCPQLHPQVEAVAWINSVAEAGIIVSFCLPEIGWVWKATSQMEPAATHLYFLLSAQSDLYVVNNNEPNQPPLYFLLNWSMLEELHGMSNAGIST